MSAQMVITPEWVLQEDPGAWELAEYLPTLPDGSIQTLLEHSIKDNCLGYAKFVLIRSNNRKHLVDMGMIALAASFSEIEDPDSELKRLYTYLRGLILGTKEGLLENMRLLGNAARDLSDSLSREQYSFGCENWKESSQYRLAIGISCLTKMFTDNRLGFAGYYLKQLLDLASTAYAMTLTQSSEMSGVSESVNHFYKVITEYARVEIYGA